MSLALYRKYRPQSWSDLTGQNHIKVTLQNEIETDKITHAYLFTGPRGIGKTTTARLFAKALNCENMKDGESEPDNKCDSCLELVEGNDLDILEIDAASHTGVDNVRENIIANARFTPVKRKYKVFIIDEVHMLSISAFNALLKILEEPPEHAIFILATTEIHKVPATIISRCQRFDFKKINSEELINRLGWICQQEGISVSKKVLTDIARVSEGCLRDAESLLGQVLSLGEKEVSDEEASLIIPVTNYKIVVELVNNLIYKNVEESVVLINKLVEEGIDLMQFTDDLIEFLRKMILTQVSGGLKEFTLDLDKDLEKSIIDLSQKFETKELVGLINLFSAKKFEIKTAAIPQLPLEIAIIEYCQNKEKNEPKDKDSGGGSEMPSNQPDNSKQGNSPPPKDTSVTKTAEVKPKKEISSGPPPLKASADKLSSEGTNSGVNATLKTSDLGKTPTKTKISVTLDEIKDQWHDFLVKMQEHNASLVFILKVAEPLELNGNMLKIGLRYEFHEQRINQAKSREILYQVLKEFFNEELAIETSLFDKDYKSSFIDQQTQSDEVELVDELPTDAGSQKELIDNLVKTFDGKIIE